MPKKSDALSKKESSNGLQRSLVRVEMSLISRNHKTRFRAREIRRDGRNRINYEGISTFPFVVDRRELGNGERRYFIPGSEMTAVFEVTNGKRKLIALYPPLYDSRRLEKEGIEPVYVFK